MQQPVRPPGDRPAGQGVDAQGVAGEGVAVPDVGGPGAGDQVSAVPGTIGESESLDRKLLTFLGAAMIAGGQPVHEVEAQLSRVGSRLGHPDTQVAATPTGLTLNLASGQPSSFESINGSLRLDQSTVVSQIRHALQTGELTRTQALEQLSAIRALPLRYPRWLMHLGFIAIASGIALILQPGLANVVFAVIGSVIVLALTRLADRFQLLATLLPTVAAFLVALVIFSAAGAGLVDGPLRTLLPPLAVLLPGALMVTGMSELAAGAMVAGSSRLTFGIVQLLLFTLGVVTAAKVVGLPPPEMANLRVDQFGWWAPLVGVAVISLGLCVLESAPFRLLPWITAVLVLAFGAQILGQHLSGAALGSFLGAIAATLGASLAEAIRPQLPRLVVFLPAFWLLVPGSLGLLSITQLGIDPAQPIFTVVGVVAVIAAIALGLMVGAAIASSVAGMIRRLRRRRTASA